MFLYGLCEQVFDRDNKIRFTKNADKILVKYFTGIFCNFYYAFSVIIPFKTESAVSFAQCVFDNFCGKFYRRSRAVSVIMFPSISTG